MSNDLVVQKKETRFSCVTQESAGGRISINPKEERITSVIAHTVLAKGELAFKEGVKIDGEVQGSVQFGLDDGMCIVSKSGVVEGNISGPRALILGTVEGDVDITGVVMVAASAVIIGKIRYGRLIVCDGAQISGALDMNTSKRASASADSNPESSAVVHLKRAAN